MAISQVRALFDGQWRTLTYDPETRRYVCDLIPAATSYHEPGGVFDITVELTNDSGAVSTVDGSIFKGLLLDAYETAAPAVVIESPEAGAFVTVSRPEIVLTAVDETGGSGVDPDTLTVSAAGIGPLEGAAAREEIDGGYRLRFVPAGPLPDGPITLSVSVRDRDGNTGAAAREITIDTVPPYLTVDRARVVVDTETITLTGKAGDATTPPVTVTITDNGETAGTAEVSGETWRFELPLVIGENFVTITATDRAGWSTERDLYLIRLITDRTQADADRVRALADIGWAHMTDAEQTEWSQKINRGAYNASDLNRVTAAVQYLGGELHRRGYLDPRRSAWNGAWDVADKPSVINFDTYVGNVRRIWAALPNEAPAPPETLENPTVDGANGLEAALVAVDTVLPLIDLSVVMSGECMSGEF